MAKKQLGQNFLFDPRIIEDIVGASGVNENDTVVEIGPGYGSLTALLCKTAGKVIAVELDTELFDRLDGMTAGIRNLELINADALEYRYEDLPPFKVVANIPYYITSPLLFRLLKCRGNLISMTLTVQKEVAERLASAPGSRHYGVPSVMVRYYGDPVFCFVIPSKAFKPAPKVDSAVVHIKMLAGPRVAVKNEELFFRVVRTAFSQRRKTLSNTLKPLAQDSTKELLLSAGIDPVRRAETLHIEEFAKLSDLLFDLKF